MRVLKVIHDQEPAPQPDTNERSAARGILFDEFGMIPLLYVSKYNYHKLPGGGLEVNENPEQALKREALEEVGCKIEPKQPLGRIIEYRGLWNMKQISDAYLGTITAKGSPQLTPKENDEGFVTVWQTLEQAIETLANDQPQNYEGLFIQQRDLAFLKEAQRVINRQKSESSHLASKKTESSAKGTLRADIKPGLKVAIVLKKDQPTGKLTQGTVKDILTSSREHHRGIKVRLQDGQVGRVQQIFN